MNKLSQCNKTNTHTLAALQDWLLPMLMNGQVTVKWAYEKIEEVGVAAKGGDRYQ